MAAEATQWQKTGAAPPSGSAGQSLSSPQHCTKQLLWFDQHVTDNRGVLLRCISSYNDDMCITLLVHTIIVSCCATFNIVLSSTNCQSVHMLCVKASGSF